MRRSSEPNQSAKRKEAASTNTSLRRIRKGVNKSMRRRDGVSGMGKWNCGQGVKFSPGRWISCQSKSSANCQTSARSLSDLSSNHLILSHLTFFDLKIIILKMLQHRVKKKCFQYELILYTYYSYFYIFNSF